MSHKIQAHIGGLGKCEVHFNPFTWPTAMVWLWVQILWPWPQPYKHWDSQFALTEQTAVATLIQMWLLPLQWHSQQKLCCSWCSGWQSIITTCHTRGDRRESMSLAQPPQQIIFSWPNFQLPTFHQLVLQPPAGSHSWGYLHRKLLKFVYHLPILYEILWNSFTKELLVQNRP